MNTAVTSTPKLTLLAIAAGLALAACGGSDNPPAEPSKPVAQTGVFLDGAVEGLDYVAGSAAKASTIHRMSISAVLPGRLLIQHALFIQDARDTDRDQGADRHQDAYAG